jgi:eukaryotic-like serine/threonine-protein kinase
VPVDEQLVTDAASALDVTVKEPLAEGGQKSVLLCDRSGETVVMKVIANSPKLPDGLRRATREVELLEKTDHPNVVKVASDLIELGEPADAAAWLEEYLDGEDLKDALSGRWSWEDARIMGLDVARGLSALHGLKVVHRDLSAKNIRKLTSGSFVVMDPGYARHTGRSLLTATGQPGTPGYLSPEHLQTYSGVPTAASDVFCVGILLFQALADQLPISFTGDLADYASRLTSVTIPDLAQLRPDLNAAELAVIRRCLHPQPARRYRNGDALAKALEEIQ